MAGIVALSIAYVLSQFYRAFLAVLSPALIEDLGATKADLSVASGAWFLAFAAMQFAVGVSLDRFGPRRTASSLLLLGGGGGAFLFSVATAPWIVTVAMALIGIGCSSVLMASVFIFARLYSPARLAVLTSSIVGIGTLGNVVGTAPLAAAAEMFGWRAVIAGTGVATVATALAMLAFVKDPGIDEAHRGSGGFGGYLELFRVKALWAIIPLTAINYAPPVGIRGLWAGPYLADVYGADAIAIGEVTLFMALAMVAGSFIYGPLDNVFGTRKWIAVVGNTIGLGALIWLALNPGAGLLADSVVFAVIGVCGASYGLLMAHARHFFPPHLIGRGVTLMNFFSIGGVAAMQFATGAVVTASAVPGEPQAAYVSLFWFYAAMLGLSLLIYLAAKDAKPR